eukprot:TRINITY_DN1868_c0_g1_i2.p1 TRINITY_DN1868_c0_g1~~TRINITY_DN1868_c0_g1_i2.p1  ORF type:complete len:130 (-),score=84.69 TRINITY_DN1868_c0_g1_i2:4-339(-)
MKNIAAYLLCVLGGNTSPSKKDISKVITAGGGEVDDDKLDAFLSAIEGKDVDELIAEGLTKIGSVGMGGGGGGGGGGGASAAAADAPAEKKEEKKVEEEEDDEEMGFGLFD